VDGAKMINATKAVGIKLYSGGPDHGTALVNNVTWRNIDVENSDWAVQIGSCYGEDTATCSQHLSAAELTDIHIESFTGVT
jgi:galacturan 1,4-alpha-galacturonidase